MVCCHTVEREHVNGQSSHEVELTTQDVGRFLVLYARKLVGVHRVLQSADKLVALGQPLVGVLDKLVVVFSRHCHICIVVPWHETLVTHGAEHGACDEIVVEPVFAAHIVYSKQHVEYVLL